MRTVDARCVWRIRKTGRFGWLGPHSSAARKPAQMPILRTCAQDFYNLADVYMDAVFHPRCLSERAVFEQEGWHYELEAPDGEMALKGVVFNEMKGVYSQARRLCLPLPDFSRARTLRHATCLSAPLQGSVDCHQHAITLYFNRIL